MSITALDPMLEDALLTRSKIDEAIRPIQAALDSPTIRAINAALAFKPPAMSLIESAISPELKSVPDPSSDCSAVPVLRSTHHRTNPPAKIGAVVAIGRYEPTAKESE